MDPAGVAGHRSDATRDELAEPSDRGATTDPGGGLRTVEAAGPTRRAGSR